MTPDAFVTDVRKCFLDWIVGGTTSQTTEWPRRDFWSVRTDIRIDLSADADVDRVDAKVRSFPLAPGFVRVQAYRFTALERRVQYQFLDLEAP